MNDLERHLLERKWQQDRRVESVPEPQPKSPAGPVWLWERVARSSVALKDHDS